MRKRLVAGLVLALLFSATAVAQWIYNEEEDTFGEGGEKMILVTDLFTGFGVKCSPAGLRAFYATPEKVEEGTTLEAVNRTHPKLLVRVDKNPPYELDATFDVTMENRARAWADDIPPKLVKEIRDAKRRIAVAVRILGKIYHKNSYPVRGSTAAARRLIKRCSLIPAEKALLDR